MKKSYKTKNYRPSKRGLTLVGKNGVISKNSKNNVEKYKRYILDRTDISEADKIGLIADIDAYVQSAHRQKKKLTTNGLEARYAEDKIERLITNAGYSIDEFAEEAGVSVDEVMNADNWSDGLFMGKYEINFQYTGSILKLVI